MGNRIQRRTPGPQRIPGELKKLHQWVLYKLETRKGKQTKVPYQLNGQLASTTDPKTWASFEEVQAAASKFDGIGFVFSADDPYCGLDLDGAVEDGEIDPSAQKLIDRVGSYAELSPSKTGVHVLLVGEVEDGKGSKGEAPWGGKFECYDRGRFFTVTGDHLEGTPRSLNGRGDVEAIRDEMATYHDDTRLLNKALRGAPKFKALFEGDSTDEHGDGRSDADHALCKELARRTQDPEQIKRLLWRSGLVREKWERGDYLPRTIENALAEVQSESPAPRNQWTWNREEDVERQRYMLQVREEARRLNRAEAIRFELTDQSLTDQLAIPPPEFTFRIEGLHPAEGNALLVGSKKLGKTSMVINVAASLADGTPLFGVFDVEQVDGGIAVWNYETTDWQLIDWFRRKGIENTDRIFPQHFRGQGIVPIWLPDTQDDVVEWMTEREVKYWLLDPAATAWLGLVDNENDNALVAAFLLAIDEVKYRSGIQEVLLTHHTGWDPTTQDRSRGAKRIEDWPDANWSLTGEKDALEFEADGRDVDLQKGPISFDPETHTFTRRPEKELQDVEEAQKAAQVGRDKLIKQTVMEALGKHGELTQNTLLGEVNVALKKKGETGISSKTFLPKAEGYAVSPGPITYRLEDSGKNNKTRIYYLKEATG